MKELLERTVLLEAKINCIRMIGEVAIRNRYTERQRYRITDRMEVIDTLLSMFVKRGEYLLGFQLEPIAEGNLFVITPESLEGILAELTELFTEKNITKALPPPIEVPSLHLLHCGGMLSSAVLLCRLSSQLLEEIT